MDKRILDEATRKALEGYIPFSTNCTVEISLTDLIPKDQLTIGKDYIPVFTIRSFTQAEAQQFKSSQNEATLKNLVRVCLMGWVNLFDAGTKEEISYRSDPAGGCDKNLFEQLPEFYSASLLKNVMKISGLSTIEALGLK
jgi:hypothetical protein